MPNLDNCACVYYTGAEEDIRVGELRNNIMYYATGCPFSEADVIIFDSDSKIAAIVGINFYWQYFVNVKDRRDKYIDNILNTDE